MSWVAAGAEEPRLDAAAQSALELLTAELRKEVVEAAVRRVGWHPDESGLTVTDILRAWDEVLAGRRRKATRAQRVAVLYIALGASVALVGLLAVLLLTVVDTDAPSQVITVVVSATGVLLAMLGAVALILQQQRLEQIGEMQRLDIGYEVDLSLLVLDGWAALERDVRRLMEHQLGYPEGRVPLSKLLSELASTGLLDREDMDGFRRLLDVRNEIVHRGRRPDPEEVSVALSELSHLQEKLRKAMA